MEFGGKFIPIMLFQNLFQIYILEQTYRRIKVFDSDGNYLRSFGGYGFSCNKFYLVFGFEIYDDKIYVNSSVESKLFELNCEEIEILKNCTRKNILSIPNLSGETFLLEIIEN